VADLHDFFQQVRIACGTTSEIYELGAVRMCWKSFRRQVLEILQTDTVETATDRHLDK